MSANVALTDTFDQWRVKTNEVVVMTQTDGMSNFIKLLDTTNSTSNTTGSIITAGGLGIAKSAVIGENLRIHGNVITDGDTTISGNLTFGDADTDQVTFTADINSSIIPNANLTFNLGNTTQFWANTWTGHATITQKTDSGKSALTINSTDTNVLAIDINASQIDADVLDITADAVTTATVIQLSADALTTGTAIYIDSNSDSTGIRNIASVVQNHVDAVNSTTLHIQSDAGRGVFIDSTLAAGGFALEIDAAQQASNTAKIASAATTGTILDIQAESLTTGRGINYYDDSLTTGSALYIDSNSAEASGARNIASIIQNHSSASGSTTLYLRNDHATADALKVIGAVTVGVDGTGHDVIFYGDTAGRKMTWDESEDSLKLVDNTKLKIGTSADMQMYHDGSNSFITNEVGALKLATENTGIAITIGHTTSETTVADNLTVTGTHTQTGATQINSTLTIGVDGTGHDVIICGDTASSQLHWDASGDDLILNDARLVVDQDDNTYGINIDSEATTAQALHILAKYGIYVNQDISNGYAAHFSRNIAEAGANPLVSMIDEHTSTTETTLYLRQDGTGDLVNFYDGGTERFTILDGGNVGINQSVPASALHVTGDVQVGVNDVGHTIKFFGNAAGALMQWDNAADSLLVRGATADAAGSSGRIVLQTAQVAVTDGDILGRVDFQAPLESGGTDAIVVAASVYAEADGDAFGSTRNNTDIVFATAFSGAATEKMRIHSATGVTFADGAYDVNIASHDGTNGLKLGGTLVTQTAAQLNSAASTGKAIAMAMVFGG